ncbi:helix-turn-helix domain-containing protein [Exiguobacterium flavidum]|uniref:helix-turn-helix domain-containing protein n=1 Tax=Exiguobacterium flavidum TaxID=2184695 RepID=UPI000DF7ED5B|nr:helix-turn-helix domain-containing protein [Exiguobacterium flavidum]
MLTTKQISDLLRVSEETVRRWIRTGELAAEQDGKSYLVDEEALKRLVSEKSQIPGTALNKLVPVLEDLFGPQAAQFARETLFDPLRQMGAAPERTMDAVEGDLARLKREKRRLELEHELKLLELDEKIAKLEQERRML